MVLFRPSCFCGGKKKRKKEKEKKNGASLVSPCNLNTYLLDIIFLHSNQPSDRSSLHYPTLGLACDTQTISIYLFFFVSFAVYNSVLYIYATFSRKFVASVAFSCVLLMADFSIVCCGDGRL